MLLLSDEIRLSAILDGVVQKRGNSLVFVAAVLQDDGGHGDKVSDVGDVGAFSRLGLVKRCGVVESLAEALAKWTWDVHGRSSAVAGSLPCSGG